MRLGMYAFWGVAAVCVAAGSNGFAQQGDRTQQLLERLADAPGPSGAEEAVRTIMVGEMKGGWPEVRRSGTTGWAT